MRHTLWFVSSQHRSGHPAMFLQLVFLVHLNFEQQGDAPALHPHHSAFCSVGQMGPSFNSVCSCETFCVSFPANIGVVTLPWFLQLVFLAHLNFEQQGDAPASHPHHSAFCYVGYMCLSFKSVCSCETFCVSFPANIGVVTLPWFLQLVLFGTTDLQAARGCTCIAPYCSSKLERELP